MKQIRNNPTVHYTTAPSFIQFPHYIRNFIQNKGVQIGEVWQYNTIQLPCQPYE
jgi:hypothetical protein